MKARNLTIEQASVDRVERVHWGAVLVQLGFLLVAVFLWQDSLKHVDLHGMSDYGLLSVLPVTYYLAIALLTASFCFSNADEWVFQPLLFLHVLLLILFIHGTPQILYGTLRYPWAWKHVGIVDYIQRHGSVNPEIGYLKAYHNWPGFFTLNAFLTQVSGFQSALSYAGWAPFFFNAIDCGALYLVMRALTTDRRLVWLSIWFFYLTNWIGQDYFSPQAENYFLYLVVLGICLTWFSLWATPTREMLQHRLKNERLANAAANLFRRSIPAGAQASTPLQRVGLLAVLLLLFFVIASSHQLTPFMLISALLMLAIFQVLQARSLPALMAVITASWIIYMAVAFLGGNLGWIVQSIGSLTGNLNANFLNLSRASAGQVVVSWIDRGLTALVGLLAILGFFRRLRAGKWDLAAAMLVVSPLPMAVANAYGGEMIFRVYFFALPFMAFFAATLVYPNLPAGRNLRAPLAALLMSLVMLFGFSFGYYGKEEMYYFPPEEVKAAQFLNDTAPRGALLMSGTAGWPLQFKNYEFYDYLAITDLPEKQYKQILQNPVSEIIREMSEYKVAFLAISRSQMTQADVTGELPPGTLNRIQEAMRRSGQFQVVYSDADTVIFQRNTPGASK